MPQQREAHPENVLRIVATQFFPIQENGSTKSHDCTPVLRIIELCSDCSIAQNPLKRNPFSKVLAEWRNFFVDTAFTANQINKIMKQQVRT